MRSPFLILFALSTLLAAAAVGAAMALIDGGGPVAALLLAFFALPAGAGIAALARIAYLDGRAARGSVVAVRKLRRRL